MKEYFTAEELFEIRTSLGERLEKKEQQLDRFKGIENKDKELLELIESNEKDISDIRSALDKIKSLGC